MLELFSARLCGSLTIAIGMALTGSAFGQAAFEPSLKLVPVLEPTTINDYIANREAAVRLGKALFWDVRIGSDGNTACATCHHQAGADARINNTFHPGTNGQFKSGTEPGARAPLAAFPFTHVEDPANRFSTRLQSHDDVAGSQGVFREVFNGVNTDYTESCTESEETVWVSHGQAFPQVTGRNAPSVINAVHNVRQFWDGRANAWFNGLNPFGTVDTTARVWKLDMNTGRAVQVRLSIDHASLASQAVGPVNNDVEMAAHGRNWVNVAHKLLSTKALATQRVSPTDSVLGAYSAGAAGLTQTYEQMIRAAFKPEWCSNIQVPGRAKMIEANMALFFGLAVQMYEATLVSDDTRYDQWVEQGGPAGTANTVMTEQELRGLRLFFNLDPSMPATNCRLCHFTPLFTGASYVGEAILAGNGVNNNGNGDHTGPIAGAFPGAPDSDNDGWPDIVDAFPFDPAEWLDTDHDHIGNNEDLDDDNDGLPDIIDPWPLDPRNIPEPTPLPPNFRFPPAPLEFMNDNQDALARVVVFKEPPLGFEPSVRLLDFPLNGGGVTVFDPAGKHLVWVPLPPRNLMPNNWRFAPILPMARLGPTAALFVDVLVRDGNLTLGISVLNVPIGDYRVEIDGVTRATLQQRALSVYDTGFYNIGVRPTTDDLGVGGTHPNGTPLSVSRRVQQSSYLPEFGQLYNGGGLAPRVDGCFKTPTLRNVELTGPYFHNGSMATLEDVIRFYNRGGDFHEQNEPNIHPALLAMDLEESHVSDLAAFLRTLTDERVRNESAPFDHPSLVLPDYGTVPAVGRLGRAAAGATPIRSFAENLAIADPWIGDCDRNGLLDSFEIAQDPTHLDVNHNGVLDACENLCPADIDHDHMVGGGDLAVLLAAWGMPGAFAGGADIDGSGVVDGGDLSLMLNSWGACAN